VFELSVAYKYLIPRWRQLSVSIISLVSTLVIALVVWLIVVFFSVKDGLENSWIDKITALTAPVRITPTEKYYRSYYYLADTISANSNYTAKTIEEKRLSLTTDPYDADYDEEPPAEWQSPDRDSQGNLKDIVKTAYLAATSIKGVDGLTATDYETTLANLRVRLLRNIQDADRQSQQYLEHASLIGSFDADTPSMAKALIPPNAADYNNLLQMQAISSDNIKEESPKAVHTLNHANLIKRLQNFFRTVEITSLKTPVQGWRLPPKLLANTELEAVAIFKDNKIVKITVPAQKDKAADLALQLHNAGIPASRIMLKINGEGIVESKLPGQDFLPLAPWTTINLEGNTVLPAHIVEKSINTAKMINHLQFAISGDIQGYPLKGYAGLGQLEIAEAKTKAGASNALIAIADQSGITMPSSANGEPVLLPKGFRDNGAHIGDQGYLAYFSPTPSAVQEQRIPVFVAGFYDPGIIPIGGKYILAGRNLTALIRASYNQEGSHYSNGINLRFNNLADAPRVKSELQKAFQNAGIAPYWQIETYQEYEFSKDIIQQLQSEKNLFSLISLVIIVVACSNIISMLIILVNDKKLEIGILRSMGATSASIATIFGICGMVMGAIGSLVGILAAILTLNYVNELVELMSRMQGHDLFNPVFYGTTLPTELSLEALMFVIMTTVAISLLAGIVPAFKASMMRPSAILRSE
jgi:lipoprotein-releasing system permease protein